MLYNYPQLKTMVSILGVFGSPFVQRSTVRVISAEGIKEFPVQINNGFSLKEEVCSLPETIEQIILRLEENLRSEKHVELFKKKLFLDSGGLNGTYLTADLAKLGGSKKLFISLNRAGDVSANTCAFYWVKCPEKLDDNFKTFLKGILRKSILELCKSLSIRASLREEVIPSYREFRRSLIKMN